MFYSFLGMSQVVMITVLHLLEAHSLPIVKFTPVNHVTFLTTVKLK